MQLPEQQARQTVDTLLTAAGWTLQGHADFNGNAGVGVTVREVQLPNGAYDYLLFVDGKAAGVIEAKKRGTTLSSIAEQLANYINALAEHLARWDKLLRHEYESNGEETCFCDQRYPKTRSGRLFAIHQPQTLLDWLKQLDTLRGRLRRTAKAKAAVTL